MKKKHKPKGLRVNYAMAVHDHMERKRVLAVLDEHRTIMGQETEEFENRTAKFFGHKHAVMVNSGSSANLIAFDILDLPKGSEIITPILTFSTTVAPLVQKGIIPVFVDVEEGKFTINIDSIEPLINKKTKALMIPLLLGNIPDLKRLLLIARKHSLYLILDCCDTFAPTFNGKKLGSYADITTTSFYGSHILTAGGGGGMIMMHKPKWRDQAKVLRGWGRSSSLSNESESIEKRFNTKVDGIPYDTKFIFSDPGYNFMPMEMGAAFGNAQLDKINKFREIRERNFKRLYKFFKKYDEYFILPLQSEKAQTWWLGFPLTIREGAPFDRLKITTYLEENNIQTRPVFTGNILRQPGFKNIEHKKTRSGIYPIANAVMERGFVIGCHHGMTENHLEKIEDTFKAFIRDL